MEMRKIIIGNWLTRKIGTEKGSWSTFLGVLILVSFSFIYFNDFFHSQSYLAASFEKVFKNQEYWRLWSALLIHADISHLLGNLFLFVPFSYFLSTYFSLWLFPLFGLFIGGIINGIVLQSLPPHVELLGVSGVVYWMGAVWMTLSFLIDNREKYSERLLKFSGVSLILFFPTTFLPEISYLSHALGYFMGIFCGIIIYFFFRERFLREERIEFVNEDELFFDWENFNQELIYFKTIQEASHKTIEVYFKEKKLGLIDLFIDQKHKNSLILYPLIFEKKLRNKGLGSLIIKKFVNEYSPVEEVDSMIAEPQRGNLSAIKAFKNAGFEFLEDDAHKKRSKVLMIKKLS